MMIRYSRATGRTRTGDPRITNALLYQLSHNGNTSADDAEIGCKSTAFLRNMQMFVKNIHDFPYYDHQNRCNPAILSVFVSLYVSKSLWHSICLYYSKRP